MKITYIHHSSFCVELEKQVLVFDYYDGSKVESCPYYGKMPEFPKDTPLYVFSSHSHRDHFDKKVLTWSQRYHNIHYIFSKEIKRKLGTGVWKGLGCEENIKERIHYVKPGESLDLEELQVETLTSTDSGVAFLITCEEKTIYHAGDLNWWHWEGESETANYYQKVTYQEQINSLSQRKIDVAFVVLDPRQGEDMYLGIDYFMNHVNAKYVIPMHMWKKYQYSKDYKEQQKQQEWKDKILEFKKENQEMILE
ncbi:MAG: MBL fold metallo-hydrolase [Lachnospiraceae bacterium]